jgi:predicted nucleic-acid-binding Zn-ribbon protein
MAKPFVRQVFEIRYFPLFQFFDNRSKILGNLFRDPKTKNNNFEHWQLRDSRVDFFDADQKRVFFVSYQNCGYQCQDPPSENYSKDQILKYMTLTSEVIGEDIEEVQRVGFRETRVLPVDDLQNTKKLLREGFVRTDSPFFAALDSKLTDFTLLPLVFQRGEHNFQITLGPATKAEAQLRVGDISDLPEDALFLDVDYFSLKPDFKNGLRPSISDFLNKSHATLATIRQQLMAMGLL